MAEVTEYAYQQLRDFIEANWKWIELQDPEGNPIIRLSPDDARVTWSHAKGDRVLNLRIVVTGDDAEINLPVTFAKSVIYDSNAPDAEPISVEPFTNFTMEDPQDQIVIQHKIQVPRLDTQGS